MSERYSTHNFQEIGDLPHVELNQRTKAALDEFVQALRTGEHVTEKARIYQAYEDERMKRRNNAKAKSG